jgi:ABC-type phosphate/phosphonate transport system substrate-binding protein
LDYSVFCKKLGRKVFFFSKKKSFSSLFVSMPIAALPMYDFDELREATDALWSAIASRLGPMAPDSLSRGAAPEQYWTDPNLLLGQTCGYPLVTSLRGKVSLLATPRYRAAGYSGALYRSAVVVRAGDAANSLADLRGRICAVNEPASNSGMNLLRAAVAPLAAGSARFFGGVVMTGDHAGSVRAVAQGRADVASIDCVTWAHVGHLRPSETSGLRVLTWTEANPGLPLVTSVHTAAPVRGALLRALHEVAHDPALAPVRDALLLEGFEPVELSAYDSVLALEHRAQAAGYGVLQ